MAQQAEPVVFDHPLIRHKLTALRDERTDHARFRDLMSQIASLMVYEITRTFATSPCSVRTPTGDMAAGAQIRETITVVPVLRAGLGMTDGILRVMPEARIGHLGMSRDEESMQPTVYLRRLPTDLDAGPTMLVDPMLATGGSAVAAVRILRQAGACDLRMMSLVAAPAGIDAVRKADPGVRIYVAAIDERLDASGFIRPGLGDAGDRLFGTL